MIKPHFYESDDLTACLSWRYAIKHIAPEGLMPAEKWRAIEQALLLTPSTYGLQSWRFIQDLSAHD